jgi:hypothetical protein
MELMVGKVQLSKMDHVGPGYICHTFSCTRQFLDTSGF